MTLNVRPVVLSGGAGTRLWPLSTGDQPKQFLALLGEPLFEATLARISGLKDVGPITVVTGSDHLAQVERAASNLSLDLDSIVIEPVGRNTAAAVTAAALVADPEDVLVVLPSDHTVADLEAFRSLIDSAVELAVGGALVTFGAEASRPETGFGYIEKGEPMAVGYHIARFKEKPDAEEATRLAAGNTHLWNSGMFVFTAARFLEEARLHNPDLVEGVSAALPIERSGRIALDASFERVASISIDHAVMEKTAHGVVIPMDIGWSDIGSWHSLWELSEHDEFGNTLVGEVTAVDVTNSYIHAGTKRVAVAGVDGMVVVETPDAVLVIPMATSQDVRRLVDRPGDERSPD